jgi:acetylornithine/succinyldiaminopimelate/putrescine aminotransferase
VRFSPPLMVDKNQCEYALKVVDESLAAALAG